MREKPSPYNIIPTDRPSVIEVLPGKFTISVKDLNIPFKIPPYIFPKMGIPDTNSMDGLADYGNDFIYLQPDISEQPMMVDFMIDVFEKTRGLETFDCAYRIMYYPQDDPYDFSKPNKKHGYAIHRIVKTGYDKEGVYFKFKGIKNWFQDLYKVRPKNILMLSSGVIY